MEGLLMKARSHTAFWEIKYYFDTTMFSKVFWYSMGSCKTNNIKVHQAVQGLVSNKQTNKRTNKKTFTLSTCSKTFKRRIL
jgi:hypothetical protein